MSDTPPTSEKKLDPNRSFATVPQIMGLGLCVVYVTEEGGYLVSLAHRVVIAEPNDTNNLKVFGPHKYVEITNEIEVEINKKLGNDDSKGFIDGEGFPGMDSILDWITENPDKLSDQDDAWYPVTQTQTEAQPLGEVTLPAVWKELIVLGFEEHPEHGMIIDRLGDETAEIVKVISGPAPTKEDGRAMYDDGRTVTQKLPNGWSISVGLCSGQGAYWGDFDVLDEAGTPIFEGEPFDEFPEDALEFTHENVKYKVPIIWA